MPDGKSNDGEEAEVVLKPHAHVSSLGILCEVGICCGAYFNAVAVHVVKHIVGFDACIDLAVTGYSRTCSVVEGG